MQEYMEIAKEIIDMGLQKGLNQIMASISQRYSGSTRFANSQITQNIAYNRVTMTLLGVLGKRVGDVTTSDLTKEGLLSAVDMLMKVVRSSPEDPYFDSLPKKAKLPDIKQKSGSPPIFDPQTARSSPETRASKVKRLIDAAHDLDKRISSVAGSLETGSYGFAVANSNGVESTSKISTFQFKTSIIATESDSIGDGYADFISRKAVDEPEALGRKAARWALDSLNPKKIELGDYPVILSSAGMSDLFDSVLFLFTAFRYQNHQTPFTDRLGDKLYNANLSVSDNALDSSTFLTQPIDSEGVPKRPFPLINKGVVENIAYDLSTARKEKKPSTGHAQSLFKFYRGPAPLNIILPSGDSTVEEMIRETKKGLFINKLHYINPANPVKGIFTGMTRYGTFLVENGEIQYPVHNLRFTESLDRAFEDIQLIGNEKIMNTYVNSSSMLLPTFKFTGITV